MDVNQAIRALKSQVDAIQPTTTLAGTTTEILNTVTNTVVDALAGLGTVNDQTGQTAYTTQSGDAGALLILNDASPVGSFFGTPQRLPAPFALFITNFGAGVATLTPTSGTINGGASLTLLQNQSIWLVFNGTNWLSDAFTAPPLNSPAAATKFLTAYASATGVFTNAQPAFTDIQRNDCNITTSGICSCGEFWNWCACWKFDLKDLYTSIPLEALIMDMYSTQRLGTSFRKETLWEVRISGVSSLGINSTLTNT